MIIIVLYEDVHCAVLDSMYLNEGFDTAVANALETTTNLAGDRFVQFNVKLPSAILTCVDGYEAFVASIEPVLLDSFVDTFENKYSLGKIIEDELIRQEIRTSLTIKGRTVANILFALKKMKENPGRMCSILEGAHEDLHAIVSQFASRNLHYHNFPSATAQLMLTVAPIATRIALTLPYLESETQMNCRLKDLLYDNFQLSLLHRFKKK